MSTTDPSSTSPGGTDPMEVRLRHALGVVAASTPIPEAAPGVASLPSPTPVGPSGDRTRPVWRVLAAAAVVLAIVGGVAVFATQRDRAQVVLTPSGSGPPPSTDAAPVSPDYRLSDHWHEAYGFYVCDSFLPPAADAPGRDDVLGIHTHGEGIIHIHPFGPSSSGPNARLELFGDQIGVDFSDDGWRLPDGTEYRTGRATCGGQPADVVIYRWSVDSAADPGQPGPVAVYTDGFGDIVFDADRQAYTFAVVPRGTIPPRPPTIPRLDQLADVPPGPTAGSIPN